MTPEEERIAQLVRDAFAGVTLGTGVGLWQGQALDDYGNDATVAKYRSRDEKMDWTAIPVEDLNRCESSLSFFDAEGMRFHLPAFLIAGLQDMLGTHGLGLESVIFHLTYLNDYGRSQFALLNDAQKSAVREFLLLFKDDSFDDPSIQRALAEFWTK